MIFKSGKSAGLAIVRDTARKRSRAVAGQCSRAGLGNRPIHLNAGSPDEYTEGPDEMKSFVSICLLILRAAFSAVRAHFVLLAFLTGAATAAAAMAAGPGAAPRDDGRCASVSAATCRLAVKLGRGINVGNALEAPEEGQYGMVIDPRDAGTIRDRGFDHVRLPVRWSNHADRDAGARLDPDFSNRVGQVIDRFLGAGLRVVVDFHHYRQLDGDPLEDHEFMVPDSIVEARMVSIWRQVAERYKGYPDSLYFELYNEPHGALTDERWNRLLPKLLAAVRRSNPSRPVIVGPGGWNSVWHLDQLELPADGALIVTVHQYDPHAFTHQGAWGSQTRGGSVKCCSPQDRATIAAALNAARQWGLQKGYPMYVGEFGAHISADPDSRREFLRAMRTTLGGLELPWAVFNYGADFGLFDTATRRWNEPLLGELLP